MPSSRGSSPPRDRTHIAKLLVFLSCFLLYKRSRVMTCGGNSPLSAACLHAKQKVWRDIAGSLCQAGVKQEED